MSHDLAAPCPPAQSPLQGHDRSLLSGALTLRPRSAQVLHILQGRVWLTLGEGAEAGDLFLGAGDSLHLPAGRCAVMEPYPAQPVYWALGSVVPHQTGASLFQALRRLALGGWGALRAGRTGWRAAKPA